MTTIWADLIPIFNFTPTLNSLPKISFSRSHTSSLQASSSLPSPQSLSLSQRQTLGIHNMLPHCHWSWVHSPPFSWLVPFCWVTWSSGHWHSVPVSNAFMPSGQRHLYREPLFGTVSLPPAARAVYFHVCGAVHFLLDHHNTRPTVLVSLEDCLPGPVIPKNQPFVHNYCKRVRCLRSAINNLHLDYSWQGSLSEHPHNTLSLQKSRQWAHWASRGSSCPCHPCPKWFSLHFIWSPTNWHLAGPVHPKEFQGLACYFLFVVHHLHFASMYSVSFSSKYRWHHGQYSIWELFQHQVWIHNFHASECKPGLYVLPLYVLLSWQWAWMCFKLCL